MQQHQCAEPAQLHVLRDAIIASRGMAAWPVIWKGRWIWCGPPVDAPPAPLSPQIAGIDEHHANRFCMLRHAFTLDAVPAAAPARVTADSRYVLWVNGTEVHRGPA